MQQTFSFYQRYRKSDLRMVLSSTLRKHIRALLVVDGMRVGRLYVVVLHEGLVYLRCYRLLWSV